MNEQIIFDVTIIQKSDTLENWIKNNPILKSGQFGYDTTVKKFKIGDGVSTWDTLPYYSELIDGGVY